MAVHCQGFPGVLVTDLECLSGVEFPKKPNQSLVFDFKSF